MKVRWTAVSTSRASLVFEPIDPLAERERLLYAPQHAASREEVEKPLFPGRKARNQA